MREDRDLGVTPTEAYVRMMTLIFGHLAHPVHEVQRLPEVSEAELPLQVMFLHHYPTGNLLAQFLQFSAFERRNVAAARRARLVCQRAHAVSAPEVWLAWAKCSS